MQGQGMSRARHAGPGMMHGGNDMMKMGTQVFSGKIGPWNSDARMIDMKAQMEGSGMKAQGDHAELPITSPSR